MVSPATIAPKKRACDSCHKRKIHCDAAVPRCNWCKHHGLACTFNRVVRPRGRAKNTSDKDVAERLERLEQLLLRNPFQPGETLPDQLAKSTSSSTDTSAEGPQRQQGSHVDESPGQLQAQGSVNSTPSTPGAPQTSSTSFGKLHFAGYHLGGISSFNGIPFFSKEGHEWIQFRTGTLPVFPKLSAPPWQGQQQLDHAVSALDLKLELPDRQTVEQYFCMYKPSRFRQIFPIVDNVLWAETIDLAYQPWQEPYSSLTVTARASVFSFLAVTTMMEGKLESSPPVDAEECALKAMHLTPLVLMDTSLLGLQFCFMQSMYYLFTGKLQNATMFHSVACRIVFILGAHVQVDLPPSAGKSAADMEKGWRYRNHLRNLFWLCYVFDKDISLRTGQPPAIDDSYCNLTLPIGYSQLLYNEDEDWPKKDTIVLPSDIRISMIKSKTAKLLYSAEALLKSDAHLLRDIRELDNELESWRMSIPPQYRPTLSWSREARIDPVVQPPRRMHIIIIHFEYHYLMATIHRATGRCHAWESGEGGEISGVSSSLSLSVEASRSTLAYLRAAIHDLYGESFWMTVFYPMSAIITIFCNVLLRPTDPRSKDDMELLEAAPELIQGMRTRRLTADETVHMRMVEDFMAELIRLGNCAVNKALQDRRSATRESFG